MEEVKHPAQRPTYALLAAAFFIVGLIVTCSGAEPATSSQWFAEWTPAGLLAALLCFALSMVFLTVHLVSLTLLRHELWRSRKRP